MRFDKFFLVKNDSCSLPRRGKIISLDEYEDDCQEIFNESLNEYTGFWFEDYGNVYRDSFSILLCVKESELDDTCGVFPEISRLCRDEDLEKGMEQAWFCIFNYMIVNNIKYIDEDTMNPILDCYDLNKKIRNSQTLSPETLKRFFDKFHQDDSDDITVNYCR